MKKKQGSAHAAKRGTAPQPLSSGDEGARERAVRLYEAAKAVHSNPDNEIEKAHAFGSMVAIAEIFPDVAMIRVWR